VGGGLECQFQGLDRNAPQIRPEASGAGAQRVVYQTSTHRVFVYCGRTREFVVRTVKAPCLVLGGQRRGAPRADLRQLHQALPTLRVHPPSGKTGAALDAAKPAVKAFLAKHTPAR